MTYLILLAISIVLTRISWVISENNRQSRYNGLGCVDDVMSKQALAPMCYRVLFPILLYKIPLKYRESLYAIYQVIAIFLLLLTANIVFGIKFVAAFAILLPLTIRFDYWDWIFEIGALIACLSGNLYLVIPWCFASAASRETSIMLPIVWLCAGLPIIKIIPIIITIVLTTLAIRLWQGKKKRYCDAIMVDKNGKDLKYWILGILQGYGLFDDMAITILVTIAGLITAIHFGLPAGLPIIITIVAGWTFGIARETRVIAPVIIWICMWLVLFI